MSPAGLFIYFERDSLSNNTCRYFSIIGEDKTLSIKIGQEAGGETEDFILVRGASADVDRAIKEIYAIAENAKNELIDNSYVCEFTFTCRWD